MPGPVPHDYGQEPPTLSDAYLALRAVWLWAGFNQNVAVAARRKAGIGHGSNAGAPARCPGRAGMVGAAEKLNLLSEKTDYLEASLGSMGAPQQLAGDPGAHGIAHDADDVRHVRKPGLVYQPSIPFFRSGLG